MACLLRNYFLDVVMVCTWAVYICMYDAGSTWNCEMSCLQVKIGRKSSVSSVCRDEAGNTTFKFRLN